MSWRQAVAALALALFAFQSYVTQTHVHLLWKGTPDAFVQSLGFTHVQKTPAPGKHNPADDPGNCPICQDMALAGHFTSPATIAFLPPALAIAAAIVAPSRLLRIAAISHNWQGRAPPRH